MSDVVVINETATQVVEVITEGPQGPSEWVNITGKPATYPPSAHTHTQDQVGLDQVDNTSDATKNAAEATLTNKTLTSPVLGNGTAKGLVFLDATKKMGTAATLVWDGDKLGVGTPTPAAALHLANAVAADLGIRIDRNGSEQANLTATFDGAFLNGAQVVRFGTAGTERARFDINGNFGLGTSSPSSKLEVSNGANSNGALKISATGTAAGNFASMNFVTGTAVWTTGTEASNGRFFIYSNAASRDQLSFSGGANSDVTLSTAGTGTFRFNTGSTERLRIDTNGNLGIGTTAPSAQGLSVIKSGATDAGVQVGNGTASTYLTQSADGNFYLYNYGAYGLIFGTGGVEKMRLDASGNLGLGVTPSAWSTGKAVEIGAVGNSIFGPSANEVNFTQNAFFNAGWKYGSTQTAGRYQMQGGAHQWFTAPSGTAGAAITFTQAMTLDTNGNLGIRTTTPTNYSGSGYNSIAINGTTGGILEFQGAGTQAARITGWSNSLAIHTNNVERLRLDANGSLSLGAASTTARMLIQGSGAQDTLAVQHAGANHAIITLNQSDALGTNASYRPLISFKKGGTTSFNLSVDGSAQGLTYYEAYSATAAHVFVTNSAERVRFDPTGNVLVGRSAQSSGGKLEVAGNIVANLPSVAPTLGTNSDMSFQLVSNTQLKILVRGSDGVTRSNTLTLA